ncbi:hypothetical protein A2U01_0110879, partial [Trifolium medium]|nr:hypothetical protein [Trifolium medium]
MKRPVMWSTTARLGSGGEAAAL